MAVGNQSCNQVDQKVDRAAVARMFNLADVFELIIDGLNDGSLAQEEFVRQVEQAIAHALAKFGDELKPLGDQQLLSQRLGEIAFVPKEFAEESFGEFGNGMPIINIARREAESQELALVIDYQVQFEAIEPADRGLATGGPPGKHPMLMDAWVTTNRK